MKPVDATDRADVLGLLHRAQRESGRNYIPEERLKEIARETGITESDIYGVVTFYSMFSLQPRGEYIIRVCTSGSCHLMGSGTVLGVLKDTLKIGVGETTSDGKFTLEETSCLGACEESPAMMINEELYGNLTPEKIQEILSTY